MTKKRVFLIDENAAVNIIKSHFHGKWNGLVKILIENNAMSEDEEIEKDEVLDAAILKLSDKKIESILSDIEY